MQFPGIIIRVSPKVITFAYHTENKLNNGNERTDFKTRITACRKAFPPRVRDQAGSPGRYDGNHPGAGFQCEQKVLEDEMIDKFARP